MDKETTITKIIEDIRNEVANTDLLPERAAELLTKLSALLGNILNEITRRDMEYNKILLEFLKNEKSANRAKIVAGTTEEYKTMRDARNAEKVAIELIRSLKYYLNTKSDEYEAGKYH